MKLKSMKLTRAEAKSEPEWTPPEYPYGLCLYLDEDILQKLGIKSLDEFEIDEAVSISGIGVVTGISMHKYAGGEERRSLDIQITDLAIAPDGTDEDDKPTVGESVYGKSS